MSYKLVVSEKPSVGAAYAKVLGATNRQNGYLEGNGYLVSWCIGHLVELAPPNIYRSVLKKRAACIGTVQNEGDWAQPNKHFATQKWRLYRQKPCLPQQCVLSVRIRNYLCSHLVYVIPQCALSQFVALRLSGIAMVWFRIFAERL